MALPSAARHADLTLADEPRARWGTWRWVAVLLVVGVLHWIAAQWVERHRATLNPSDDQHLPVQVALLKPERIERTPAPTASAAPAQERQRKPAASKPREPVLTALRPAEEPTVQTANAASDAAASEPVANAVPASSPAGASASASASGNTNATQAAPGVKFSVPPSGDLQYDTFYNGVRNQPGTIHWTSSAQSYDMVVSVPLPFVGTFVYSSHGRIDAFGLAPEQYVEKRGHRAEDVSIFNRADRKIAFTRTPATLPLPDGAQDRFSMVMQLASLVRGDPAAYKPGVTRQFFVVDSDSGEEWPVETIGDETIRTAQGFLETRHFKRLPRREGDQRRIDVWLAPSLGWLPARLVQTEPNGTQFELVWRGKLDADNGAGSSDASANTAPSAAPASASDAAPLNSPPGPPVDPAGADENSGIIKP
ncbi:DUF3108 domain-containing protein [Paraburkholderia dilworthii]|uniref:DUF3108 domain-containing protein n=1 Tax=Paraburkholderia dilworthii TaxID=948106 RepID=UPI00042591FC|nr:DUF3108 domain-containing protein [Paraburkholderia dilworthii]